MNYINIVDNFSLPGEVMNLNELLFYTAAVTKTFFFFCVILVSTTFI